ncbi:MAG: glycosyltransferase [Candidatus Moranbacteria bacterium]|nr:glycosyltransferase [Candidatus Moranbacteria bacterium]
MKDSRKTLLVTRPLCPPWDEASKNFAYFLARSVSGTPMTILTHGYVDGLPASVTQADIYPSERFDLRAKFLLFAALFRYRSRFDVTHYLFTPTKSNSRIIRRFACPTRGRTIQTVATLREDLYSESELRRMLFADRIITYADASKRKLESMGFSGVERIYPGIDLERFRPTPKDPALLKRFGFTEQDFIVSYVGEYARLGATDMLAETIVSFHSQYPDSNIRFLWALRIKNADDAAKKAEVVARFESAGLADRFFCTDTFSDMPGIYNLSDAIAFPVGDMRGKFDVPLAVIEPYACGKPVILSDIPLFKEFSNPDISITVPRGDGQAFIEAVRALESDPERLAAMGRAARAYAEKEFDLRHTARRYGQVYKELAKNPA